MIMPDYSLVGRRVPRIDGAGKVTGRLKYMTDLQFPGLLLGKVLRAQHPHALIGGIDTAEAATVPGIHAVLTARDIPGLNRHGIITHDQPVLCDSKVRFLGDPVALVVGETEQQVAKAISLIRVDYEPLPVIGAPEEALQPDAVHIHEGGNIQHQVSGEVGDIEQALASADLIVEHTYTTVRQEHAFIETEGGIGAPGPDGGVTIYHPSQYCYRDRAQVSRILGLPEERVVIISSPAGGAFGGKDDILHQALLALAALKTGRPVKIHSNREESFLFGITRQPFKIRMRTAVRADGVLLGQDVEVLCDTGAYASLGREIMGFALENVCGCYRIPNIRFQGCLVFTNNQITGEFRGFGNNQMHFALESQIDLIARQLGIDPIALRKANCLLPGQRYAMGNALHAAVGAIDTLKAAEASEFWGRRHEFRQSRSYPWIRRGVGVAFCQQAFGLGKGIPDASSASIMVRDDGTFEIATSNAELGQGNSTTLAIIAGESLGVGLDKIRMVAGDTSRCPNSGTATASRDTYITGNAIRQAAERVRRLLLDAGARLLHTGPERLAYRSGEVVSDDGRMLGLADLAGELHRMNQGAVTSRQHMPETDKDFVIGLHYLQSYLTQVVGVEVNILTGKTDLLFAEAFSDAGRVINPLGYEGQVEGGIVMGMGYTLMEQIRHRDGRLQTRDFQTYLIPSAADIPEIVTNPIEILEPTGPFGAKGLGEIPSIAITPAIINAIEDAAGVRVFDLPADPERVYRLLQMLPRPSAQPGRNAD
jgi:CO/xanthine dehydrogenase Mo-binding subunit